MKLHIGTDSQTGLVHSASVTAANVHDSHQVPNLLHGEETRFYGDSAYRGKEQRERLKDHCAEGEGLHQQTCLPELPADGRRQGNQPPQVQRAVQGRASLPDLEAPVGLCQGSLSRLAKNANRAFAVLAMLNINKWGRPLTGEVRPA
jgi:IS5 family transposase